MRPLNRHVGIHMQERRSDPVPACDQDGEETSGESEAEHLPEESRLHRYPECMKWMSYNDSAIGVSSRGIQSGAPKRSDSGFRMITRWMFRRFK